MNTKQQIKKEEKLREEFLSLDYDNPEQRGRYNEIINKIIPELFTDKRGRIVEYRKDGSFYHPILPKKWVTYEMKVFWEY